MDLNVAIRGVSKTITKSLMGGYIVCSAHKMNKANFVLPSTGKRKGI